MKRFRMGLSLKLVLFLTFCLIAIFSIIGMLNIRMYRRHMLTGVYQNAAQVSDIIMRSTNYSMLTNEREGIYRIIERIAREPGILKIRIYNKEGQITFSTDESEVNTMVDMNADACTVCHKAGSKPHSGDVSIMKRTRDYYNQDGDHVLGMISPIKSEPSCVVSDCHVHSADQKVLGVIDVILQLDEVDASLHEYENHFKVYVLSTIFVVCIISILFIIFMVYRPIKKFVEGTEKIAEGNLDFKINIKSKDELGSLANSFNRMTSDLRKIHNDLVTAKAYTDNLIRSMLNSLVVVGRNATIRNVNKATCDLLGYTEEELLGKPMAFIFAKGYFDNLGFKPDSIKEFGGTGETIYQSKAGKKIRVLFSASVILDDTGKFQGVVFIAQDITVQSEAMRAGHMSSLGELAAGVAHEINNPLNSIINFAQILIDELEEGATITDELLYRIITEGDRVSNIVRSLLYFARESGLDRKLVMVNEVIHETLTLTDTQILKEGINLEVDVSETLPPLYANFQQLMQVFINIINNARYALSQKYPKASPDKKLIITAVLHEGGDGEFIDIIFQDTGTGIPSSIIDKVINPFFTTKPSGQGTGLGLAISHGIVTDHDGQLLIESVEGEYTKVTTRFPIREDKKKSKG